MDADKLKLIVAAMRGERVDPRRAEIEREIAAHEAAIAELRKQLRRPAGRQRSLDTEVLNARRMDMRDIREQHGCDRAEAARRLVARMHLGEAASLPGAAAAEETLQRRMFRPVGAEDRQLAVQADELRKLAWRRM